MITIKYRDYKRLVENGATKHLYNNKSDRAETIIYDGEIYSHELFANEYGWNGKQFAWGQEWYYKSESGKELLVEMRF